MKAPRFAPSSLSTALLALFLLTFPIGALASDDMKELLPPLSCGEGWPIEAKPLFYDRDTLSDRIDGEAELYFPYGFDRMASARYASVKNPAAGMDVEIYRLGSLLDAFGMFANYRQKEGRAVQVGAESNLSASQLYFYQGRQFVHMQITGSEEATADALARCARLVAARLPASPGRPPELTVFERPEVVKGTERYLPESLLGYDFLNKGIMADAVVQGTHLQLFLLLPGGKGAAPTAFERYRSQLEKPKTAAGGENATFLEGIDPLYGPVIILKKGECLAGALKFAAPKGIRAFLESVCR